MNLYQLFIKFTSALFTNYVNPFFTSPPQVLNLKSEAFTPILYPSVPPYPYANVICEHPLTDSPVGSMNWVFSNHLKEIGSIKKSTFVMTVFSKVTMVTNDMTSKLAPPWHQKERFFLSNHASKHQPLYWMREALTPISRFSELSNKKGKENVKKGHGILSLRVLFCYFTAFVYSKIITN